MHRVAVQRAVGDLTQSRDQLVPQLCQPGGVLVDVPAGLLQRRRQTHDAGDVLRAGPLAAFLRAALDDIGQGDALPGIQHAHALGAVELVAGQGQHVDVLLLHVDVQVARRLHRVGVEQHALLVAHLANLRDGQDRADLVVGVHDGHQTSVLPDGLRHLLGGDGACGTHVQQRHLKALFFQLLQCVQHRVVLEGGGDDVILALSLADPRRRDDGLVVGLAAAGGERDLLKAAPETVRYPPPCVRQRLRGLLAHGVQAGGISVKLLEIGRHSRHGLVAHPRGGRIICIDLHRITPLTYLFCRYIEDNI